MSRVCFMKEEAIKSLLLSADKVKQEIIHNPENSDWINNYYNEEPFIETEYSFDDFTLKINDNYSSIDFDNSVLMYEKLKHLPKVVLTDKRFWGWFEFTIGYKAAQKAIPLDKETEDADIEDFDDNEDSPLKKEKNPVKNMWLFSQSNRRSLFFNVMARCFFRVAYTVDESLEDKYKYSRFVIEKPTRFRELTWRTFSNGRELVFNVVRAEYDFYNKYGIEKTEWYTRLPKDISYLASVKMIDAITPEEIYKFTYDKLNEYRNEK